MSITEAVKLMRKHPQANMAEPHVTTPCCSVNNSCYSDGQKRIEKMVLAGAEFSVGRYGCAKATL